MQVRDIKPEVIEVVGNCAPAILYRTLTRAIELLAASGLFDPQVAYLNFTTGSDTFTIALPREIKTVLRVNINNNPTFHRSRIFEFALNTDGSVPGEEIGWTWADRGRVCVQDETLLPTKLKYVCLDGEDEDATITVRGLNEDGREISDTLTAKETFGAATESVNLYSVIQSVVRTATTDECQLQCNDGEDVVARYYPDEIRPDYRAIKLSKAASSLRIMYRKHVFAITSDDDLIPVDSPMAVIHMVKAVRLFALSHYTEGEMAQAKALQFLKDEQNSRDEGGTMAEKAEIAPAINRGINSRDGLLVLDIYDEAAEIFGPIGRDKLFDKITTTIEGLANAATWDSLLGVVDLVKADHSDAVLPQTGSDTGHGLFVCPRFVDVPLATNFKGAVGYPRNRWFEFHLNGYGHERATSSRATWDDMGETVLTDYLPLDADTKLVIPVKLVAVPEIATDDGTSVRIYGFERLADDTEVEVYRDGVAGYVVPCVNGSLDPREEGSNDEPNWVRVDKIVKGSSVDFIKLHAVSILEQEGDDDAESLGSITGETGSDETTIFTLKTGAAGRETTIIAGDTIAITVDSERVLVVVESITYLSEAVDGLNYTVVLTEQVEGSLDIPSTVIPVLTTWQSTQVLGYWYPDELEPRYRVIKTQSSKEGRIRMMYRKNWNKISSIYDPIHLRSRLAIISMMRAIKLAESDPTSAMAHEANAIRYLTDEQRSMNPHGKPVLQINDDIGPFVTQNVV